MKTLATTILSATVAFFAPIADNVYAMIYFLMANFVVGTFCSIYTEGERFKWRKAGRCAMEALVFFWLIVSLYVVGRYNGNPDGAVTAISTVIYAGGWFYATRILRNIRKMTKGGTPFSTFIDFLYTAMSMEFAKKIPGLDEYLHRHNEE